MKMGGISMKGVKFEVLGIGIILLGMSISSSPLFTYSCGLVGFGLAACGCFFIREAGEEFDE